MPPHRRPRPQRRVLPRIAVGLAVLLCPFFGVVGPLAASLMTYLVVRSSGPATLLVPALVGGLVGALSGWAVNGWRRFGPWTAVAVALAIVVVTNLLGGQGAESVGAVVWAAVLVPTLYTVGALMRRGAPVLGGATGLVGGLLAVEAGVTSSLAWLSRSHLDDGLQLWLWFMHAHSPFQPGVYGAVGFTPHGLVAGTAFAVCLLLVTQRVGAIDRRRGEARTTGEDLGEFRFSLVRGADYSRGVGFPDGRGVATIVIDSDGRSVMIEQFTGGAQRAVVRAAEEARRLDHQHIGTEHLLLGILHDGQGAAATALAGFGVSLDAVRRQVEETIGRGVGRSGAHLQFTMPAQQAIEYALAEAERREHSSAGAEHLLLGLLREREDPAVQVLVALGADADLAYRQVIESLP